MTDYAFALLTRMVGGDKGVWSAAELSDVTGLPLPTVAKILKKLTKCHIISARRGAAGGYSLAQQARDLSIADIIEAIDGPIAITDCAGSGDRTCHVGSLCSMTAGWNVVNRAIRHALQKVSLADMAAPNRMMEHALHDDQNSKILELKALP